MADPSKLTPTPASDSPSESAKKPIRFVFKRGVTAEEAHQAVQELLAKHGHTHAGPSQAKPDATA